MDGSSVLTSPLDPDVVPAAKYGKNGPNICENPPASTMNWGIFDVDGY